MKVLIIEDDQHKLKNLTEFVAKRMSSVEIDYARSVSSSIASVEDNEYNIILLDISLPSFDVTSTESGGKPQGFGGIDILRYLSALDSISSVIVVTQYEKFGEGSDEKDISVLTEELLLEFPDLLRGVIYFDSGKRWEAQLAKFLGV